jgi:hypothetical protein
MRRTLQAIGFLVLTASTLCTADAMAQTKGAKPSKAADDSKSRAAALKTAGNDAMDALRYTDALEAYNQAYALSPDPALLYNKGRALQALNQFPDALTAFTAFDEQASPELKAKVPQLAQLIAEVRAHVSSLSITCNAAGARVLVRDVAVGQTPLSSPLKLTSGAAKLELVAEGYFPYTKQVELPGGGQLSVDAALVSKSTTGILTVSSNASGAVLTIDDKRLGALPIETSLPAGSHKLTLTHPDFADLDTTTTVAAGESKSLTLTMNPPPITRRWWFWTGVGAIAAGGVTAIIAARTERGADHGSIQPGQVSAPLHRGAPGFFIAPRIDF